MINRGTKNILGVGVAAVDYEFAVGSVVAAAVAGRRCTLSALAVHGVMTGALDPVHRHRLNRLDLVVPDGQPVRWALNLLHGARLADRVSGPDLTPKVCRAAAREGLPVYLFGSTPEVLGRLHDGLQREAPGLRVAGMRPSRFRTLTPAERDELAREIVGSGARILFVGLGCPRQEVFAYEMGALLPMPILAVGAAFDYHAGLLRGTPLWMQRWGLQWAHRLFQEPRRLWRRYLVTNTQFTILLLAQWLRLWRPDLADTREPGRDVLVG